MTKVVYNARHGGFSLSQEAVLLAREISGNDKWGDCPLKGETYSDGSKCSQFHGYISGVERHDPTLVQVVETLGKGANGSYANLRIARISGNKYQISEYDGYESVIEPEDQEWIVV